MNVKDGYVHFVFNFHGIDHEFSASIKYLVEHYVNESLEDICPTHYINAKGDERIERCKSFNKYKEDVAKEFAEKVFSNPYDTDRWVERHKTWIEDACYYLAEEEFHDWYFECEFCGEYFLEDEDKADCDFYKLCKSCYNDAQKNWD